MKGFDIPFSRKVNNKERQKSQFQKDIHWETFLESSVASPKPLGGNVCGGRLRMLLRGSSGLYRQILLYTLGHLS